jgi:hypothetical protein
MKFIFSKISSLPFTMTMTMLTMQMTAITAMAIINGVNPFGSWEAPVVADPARASDYKKNKKTVGIISVKASQSYGLYLKQEITGCYS